MTFVGKGALFTIYNATLYLLPHLFTKHICLSSHTEILRIWKNTCTY